MSVRLLVVEDDPGIQDLLRAQLQDYDLTCVGCQVEAYARLQEQPFDMVLLDLRLPIEPGDMAQTNEAGVAILDQIRARKLKRGRGPLPLPVVVMTAHGDRAQVPVEILVEHGANDYLPKPFTVADLRQRLTRAYYGRGALIPAGTPRDAFEVRMAFDDARERVWIDGLRPLSGAAYSLLEALRDPFLDDLAACKAPENFTAIRGDVLALKLGIGGHSLRQRVARFRKRLRDAFEQRLQRNLDDNDVIENLRDWRGYRLNPLTVRIVEIDQLQAEAR